MNRRNFLKVFAVSVGTILISDKIIPLLTENRWETIPPTLIEPVDNIYDFGAAGSTRPRNIYVATGIVSPNYTAIAEQYYKDWLDIKPHKVINWN